jgi:carbamoyl-phosphate synthase large subunit
MHQGALLGSFSADEDGNVVICGIMQHIEQAGVHSGDSACSIPPQTISPECLATIRDWTPKLAKALKVVGLINIQYAVQDNQVKAAEGAGWVLACPWGHSASP